jgi:trehalose 6-phosphate phosphatase
MTQQQKQHAERKPPPTRRAIARETAESRLEICTGLLRSSPDNCALFLDIDGTLLDLAETPSRIVIPDGLVRLVTKLRARLGGALAINSGRRIVETDGILSPLSVVASGVHGAELRRVPEGPIEQLQPELSVEFVKSLENLLRMIPGALVEPKGSGMAVHYRLASEVAGPEIGETLHRFLASYEGALSIRQGKKVYEIIPSAISKGKALTTLAALSPFEGRIPIMIGDDIGDVPAFQAAERLEGFGLKVAGESFPTDKVDFMGPHHVRSWLSSLVR